MVSQTLFNPERKEAFIFKRAGVWWTCIRYKGKKIQKSLDTTDKTLVGSIEAKIRVELAEGKHFEKPKEVKTTVNELIDKYLEDHSKPNKKPKSYQNDTYFSKRIRKHFGKKNLKEVSPRHISEFIKKRRKDGVSNTTINHELCILRHAYNLAMKDWDLINESPFAKISIPKGSTKRVRYLSEDEKIRLFSFLPDWLEPIVVIARETGLRLSNVVNLRWNQINLFNKTIVIEITKNGNPVGIPMTDQVFNILKASGQVKQVNSGFLFCKKNRKTFYALVGEQIICEGM